MTLKRQSKKNYKSVFILRVFKYNFSDKPVYSIDEEEIERFGYAEPGFGIYELENAICETLAEVERRIKSIAKKNNGIYSFLVEEKPLGGTFRLGDSLSRRRYLQNGKLWQKSEVSGIRYFNGKDVDLGDTGFYGRDLKTIPFKEGDFVEIAGYDFVQLGIIWKMPPSIKYMTLIWERQKERCKEDRFWLSVHPDDTDDSYSVVYYDVQKDGEIGYGHTHPAVVDVLPTSLPVPKKMAAELRRRVKMQEEEYKRYWKEREEKNNEEV